MGIKALPILAVLAGLAGCAAETEPTPEEKITASLQVLDKEADVLMGKFEAAVDAALKSGQVFKEVPGNATTVVSGDEAFNCVDFDTNGEQVFCETGKVDVLTTNPNLVSVDRRDGVTLFVADKDLPALQMVVHGNESGDQSQKAVSVFLNPENCTVNDGEISVTKDAKIVQKCFDLRKKLHERMVAVVHQLAILKKIWGK